MRQPAATKTSSKTRPWPVGAFPLATGGFLLLFLVYVWLRIEPALQYARLSPQFFLNRSFLDRHLIRPGGLADYGAAFLAQFDSSNLAGALMFTVLGCLIVVATRQILRHLHNEVPTALLLVPLFLLLLMRQRADCPVLAISLGFLLVVGAAVAWLMMPTKAAWVRRIVCAVCSALVGYVAGVWSGLLFLTVIGLAEVLRTQNWWRGAGWVVLGLAAAYPAIALADAPAAAIWNVWGQGTARMLAAALYAFVPLTALALTLGQRLSRASATPAPKGRKPSSPVVQPHRWLAAPVFQRVLVASLFLAGWVCVWMTFNRREQALAEVEYYSKRGDYEQVLAAAASLKPLPTAHEIRLHLALYHTGCLLTELFAYTNQANWKLLPGVNYGEEALRAQCQTLLELGQVNEVEHLAHEALEMEGERPDLLQMLAFVNVLKDRPQAARVFLNVLRQMPAHQRWAETCLRDLEADPQLTNRVELAGIRPRLVTTDLPHDTIPTEAFLQQLLASNPQNKMAYDYLLAHYLVTADLPHLTQRLGQLGEFGYTALPRHCEEAVLLHQSLKRGEVELRGLQVSATTRQRFQSFCAAVNSGAERDPKARQALARDFGNTFWYYYLTYDFAGATTAR
jgi:hypothetical protein